MAIHSPDVLWGFFCDKIYSMTNAYNWYSQLIKPTWSPPAYLFGPVWTFLYCLIAVSFGKVFLMATKKDPLTGEAGIPFMVALPFVLNLIFNFAFTTIQFSLKNNFLSAVDILLVLATLIWAMVAIYPRLKWVALANIPYLLWVAFATILQLTITFLNR